MNRSVGLVAGGIVIVAALGWGARRAYPQARPAPTQENPATFRAREAAQNWLQLIDEGRYGESYDQAAQAFKVAVGRLEWTSKVTGARSVTGKLISRKLLGANPVMNPPKAPPGNYVGVEFRSSFAKIPSITESVVVVLEKDGSWRVINYTMK